MNEIDISEVTPVLQDELEAFLAVLRAGSLTQAAEELFISQSALSHRIQSLEKGLDMQLILRGRGQRRIGLTEEGKRFSYLAEEWISLQQEIQNFRNSEFIRTITLTALDNVNTFVMPQVLQRFWKRKLPVSLSVCTERSTDAYSYIESRKADFAIISTLMFSKHLVCTPLYQERMKFICRADSDFPDVVHPSALPPNREIFIDWTPAYQKWHDKWFGANVKTKVMVDKMSLIRDCIYSSNGWGITPANMANSLAKDGQFRSCELLEGPPNRSYYLLAHRMTVFDTYVLQFVEDLVAVLTELEDIEPFPNCAAEFTPLVAE